MRIKRMTATFGGLTEQRLELAPGLNLIQAPNEIHVLYLCNIIKHQANRN